MDKPTKTAIMLSAFVSPGVGQFVQRRWVAGAIYLVAFLVCLVLLLFEIIRPMVNNILISIDFAAHKSDLPLLKFRMIPILSWLGLSLVLYLASLLDTAAAYYRQCREVARQYSRLRAAPLPPDGKP